MKSNNSSYFVLFLIVVALVFLVFASYETGYKNSKSELGSLLMTMRIDSSFVTAGLYEEIDDNIRKTVQFYVEDTETTTKDIKLFAEVKYISVGKEIISVDNGEIWKYLNNTAVFQRQFNDEKKEKKSDTKEKKVPNSQLADNLK